MKEGFRRLLDSAEAAQRMNIPQRTLDQWRYLGKGPKYVKVGRHVRYIEDDLDAYIGEQTVTPSNAA